MYLCYMLLLQWLLVVAYPVGHLIAKIGDDHFPSEFALIGPPIALLLAKRRHQARTNLFLLLVGYGLAKATPTQAPYGAIVFHFGAGALELGTVHALWELDQEDKQEDPISDGGRPRI